jgi:RHS repeat-associated protein
MAVASMPRAAGCKVAPYIAALKGIWATCPQELTPLAFYRTRYLDPKVGRFTTRDTIGIWGDPANLGNGYAYVGNNPWSETDPLRLDKTFSEHRDDGDPANKDDLGPTACVAKRVSSLEEVADWLLQHGHQDEVTLSAHSGIAGDCGFQFDDGTQLDGKFMRQLSEYLETRGDDDHELDPDIEDKITTLNRIFGNAGTVTFFACSTGAGEAGLEFLQRFRPFLSDANKVCAFDDKVFDPNLWWGYGGGEGVPDRVTVTCDPAADPTPSGKTMTGDRDKDACIKKQCKKGKHAQQSG